MATASPEAQLNPSLKDFVSEFLSFLEREEEKLLSWGFFDVSMSIEEVALLFKDAPLELQAKYTSIEETGRSLAHIVDGMVYDGLIYRIPGEERFRTRFAEGVRLLARLRQWFRWQNDPNDARALVSDIRIHLNSRRFPIRDQSASQCWQDLEPVCDAATRPLIHESFMALSARTTHQLFQFAPFQRRAFLHIFRQYGTIGATGSVISAGTGSGKTKAFYVPAYLRVMEEIARGETNSTKAIAIYPRNVLLADQLREAVSEALKLKAVVAKFRLSRSPTFGALLGDTPVAGDFDRMLTGSAYRNWKRQGKGFVVPYLKNPYRPDAGLVWRDADRLAGRTCLYAADRQDEEVIPEGILLITREQLQAHPPDILFLSAEMLNREMGNPQWSRTFGIRRGDLAPRLLLLDEVHTYSNVQGAQIAWLIRRWRHWTRARQLHVVGLSATLRHASRHLSMVAGISESEVHEFRPADDELTEEGIEYNLAVKGDPLSGSSLLATTIQTGMLLNRLLAPRQAPSVDETEMHNNAFFGKKVFGFTDNLDTLNRWLHDMRDAERQQLASLRHEPGNLSQADLERREQNGQMWRICELIGHNLSQSLRVTGCSSQRPGVNADSDLVVATSSLEVGFDDPEVGAMLHHKRPASLSSFVQRRGRAGRRRGMRPWTVLVLSDHGADRYAFQNAERFFQPDIDSIFLPIENPFVLRTQAAYFLLDWIGLKVRRGGPFQYLTPGYSSYNAASRSASLSLLQGIIKQGAAWREFRAEFAKLFGSPRGYGIGVRMSDVQLDDILWNPPRPLLTEVVPTLVRKLERDWRIYTNAGAISNEDVKANRPMPKLIPAATFGQLDVSEVELRFPQQEGKEEEYLPLHQALSEICPGRVSKRYSVGQDEKAYWLGSSDALRLSTSGNVTLDLRSGFSEVLAIDSIDGYALYQPMVAELVQRPKDVLDSSNATWRWKTHIRVCGTGTSLPIPREGVWSAAISSCAALLHHDHSWAEITRYAHEADYVIRRTRDKIRGTLRYAVTEDNEEIPQAVAFRLIADAISITIPRKHIDDLPAPDADEVNRMRADYFRDQVRNCPALTQGYEGFLLDSLATSSLAMLTATALRNNCSLSEAQAKLHDRVPAARRVFDSMIPAREGDNDDSQRNMANDTCSAWADPDVLSQLLIFERVLWQDPDADFIDWIRRRYVAAIAQAFRTAAVSHVEDVSEDDLLVDVLPETDEFHIYLSEIASGGLGQIERIVERWRAEPEIIPLGIDYALTNCPRQRVTQANLATLEHLMKAGPTDPVSVAFTSLRATKDFFGLRHASEDLKLALDDNALDRSRSSFVSLVARLLRPGSSPDSDRITQLLNAKLAAESRRLGIQLDSRIFAYSCVNEPTLRGDIESVLMAISGGLQPQDSQLFQTSERLLLENCEDSCRECIDDRNRYNDAGSPSRGLARKWFSVDANELTFSSNNGWADEVFDVLRTKHTVTLVALDTQRTAMLNKVQQLLAHEIDVDCLLIPISIARTSRNRNRWRITLVLRGIPIA